MEKELTRCLKSEKALEIMYKMYFTRDASFKIKLKELNEQADKLSIDKDVFSIFQM